MAKVLLIGWDAADWKVINKLIDKGLMPALEGLINHGCMGKLSTLEPPMSPILWTSIATGKLADKHGILGFIEPGPSGVRPTTSGSRKTKAIWNILTQLGYKTHVVGWWPSHPAEAVNGIMVSNFYHSSQNGTLQEGTVYPSNLSGLFEHLRVHPDEITEQHLLPFVPDGALVDQKNDRRLQTIARLLAEASSIQSAATWIMDHAEWDFMGVYFNAIDMFSHHFMCFHPPKMQQVSDSDYKLYNEVVTSAYRYHDMMLEAMLSRVDKDTTVILMSDHGFLSDHLRPAYLPDEPANPVIQHSEHGILVIKGPGIKKDELIYGASLLNITPTILSLFGQPSAKDMDGVPLIQIFEAPQISEMIDSWDLVDGEYSMRASSLPLTNEENQQALKQLVELGYIEDPGSDSEKAVQMAKNEANYHLARVYMSSNRHALAIPLLEELNNQMSDEGRFVTRLARCYMEMGSYTLAQSALELFEERASISCNKPGAKTKHYIYWLQQADVVKGDLLLMQGRAKEALLLFEKVQKINPKSVGMLLKLGNTTMDLGLYDKAHNYFMEVLTQNPESDQAYAGLAFIAIQGGSNEEAAGFALDAIGLNFNAPISHFYLAKALFGMKNYKNAAEALEVCLKMHPNFGLARNMLVEVYTFLGMDQKIAEHNNFFAKAKEDNYGQYQADILEHSVYYTKNLKLNNPMVVVSGLPRSGTSVMMQMLLNGGLPVFTDNLRVSDESNPRGYYEHEAVKSIASNNKWMTQAQGQAVKIIAQLLPYIPPRFSYRVIFMERTMDEVIASQHKMLVRGGKHRENFYPGGLDIIFRKQLQLTKKWIKEQPNIDVLYVNYEEVK
jgi:predicted AlkP superfamily phosphohydrolase/phosphomutase/tetratricopeptide (TPR) repeat protein